MIALDMLPLRAEGGDVQAVIETPRGSRVKFSYDTETGLFVAKKLLALGYGFPFPFGFLPSTRADDGDPVDVLVVTSADLPIATLLKINVLGVIRLEQSEDVALRNDRVIAAPVLEGDEARITSLGDLGNSALQEIERFFIGYQRAEGKIVKLLGTGSADEALRIVEKASL